MARAKTHDRHLGIKTQIWTTQAEVALWKRAAEGEGMTLSGWLRWVAHRACDVTCPTSAAVANVYVYRGEDGRLWSQADIERALRQIRTGDL